MSLSINHNLHAYAANKTNNMIQINQIVADNGFLYRKVITITQKSEYLVQNFYKDTNAIQSSPFIINNKDNLSIFQELHIYDLRNLIFQGPLTLWSKEGKKSMSITVNNGYAEGRFTKYYTDTENKEIEGAYYRGLPDGLWVFLEPLGGIEKKVYYKQGVVQWQYDTPKLLRPFK